MKTFIRMTDAVKEVREYCGYEEVAETEGERCGEHEPVATRESVEREHADARYGDGGE